MQAGRPRVRITEAQVTQSRKTASHSVRQGREPRQASCTQKTVAGRHLQAGRQRICTSQVCRQKRHQQEQR